VTLSKNYFPTNLKFQTLTPITQEDLESPSKLEFKQPLAPTFTHKPRLVENLTKGIKYKLAKDLNKGLEGLGGLGAVLKREKEKNGKVELFSEAPVLAEEESENWAPKAMKSRILKNEQASFSLVKQEELKLSSLNDEMLEYHLSWEVWDIKKSSQLGSPNANY